MSSSKKYTQYRNKYETPPYLINDFKIIEKCKDDESLKNTLLVLFNQQTDPLLYILDLLVSIKLSVKKMNSKLVLVTEAFSDWWRTSYRYKNLTKSLKSVAIQKAITLSHEVITKFICEIFALYEEKAYVVDVIHDLLKDRKYKEAYYFMSALNLEDEFSLEEFAFPAFLLDQEHVVKSYLLKCPHKQMKFLKTLDSLYQNTIAIHDFAKSFGIGGLDKNKPFYNPKWMKKRLPTYIDFLKIDLKNCPNVYNSRVQGAMHYLIRKRFIEEAIEPEAFEELISDLLADHRSLQNEMLIKLVCTNESASAHILAKAFNLNNNQLPDCLRAIPPPSEEFISLYYRGSQLKNADDYLSLRLSQSDVKLVDSPEKYFQAVDDIAENYDVVGVDAEWKPDLGIRDTTLSLLQIAVWDTIYLFDVLTLKQLISKTHWDYILAKLFHNKEILKLGYGLENDIKEFLDVMGYDKKHYSMCCHMMDLQVAFEKLKNHYPDIVNESETNDPSYVDEVESKGLSHLCKVMLGKPLNKGNQFSNWERRPLREGQITYAALDAFCLLMIYEKLYHLLENVNLSLDELNVMPVKPNQKKTSQDKISHGQTTSENLHVRNFKVVTDCMLNGLGRYLRMLGADVVCLNEGDDPRCALEIAQAERRIILTCGSRFDKLKGYMPEEMCFCVNNKVDLKGQAAELQQRYNLILDESTLFSRCKMCNGSTFLTIQNEDMLLLWLELVDEATKWHILNTKKRPSTIYKCDVKTSNGVDKRFISIQLATLSPKVFETVKEFLVCEGCGKVYWEGSHLSRLKCLLNSVSSVIEVQPSINTFYEEFAKECSSSSKANNLTDKNNTDIQHKKDPGLDKASMKIYHVDEDGSSEDDIDDIVYC